MGETQSTVMVPLTVEQRAENGDKLALLVEQIKALKAEAKSKAFGYREQIEDLQEQQELLSSQMILGAEPKSQMEMFVGEDEARRGLAEVAAHACSCPEPDKPENRSPSCPVHGIGSTEDQAAKAAAAEASRDVQTAEAVAAAADSKVVNITDAIRANEVDVGTVEEPKAAKEFRENRERQRK